MIDRIWYGEGRLARVARVVLAPASHLYGAGVAARERLLDRGVPPVRDTDVPAISIGNLTVGGTGKTPLAAWIAARLHAGGANPAIVLRGYGADEPAVHRVLNPGIPVIVDADRLRGTRAARAAGNDVAVLDDAFQHRRAARLRDVVLVSADRWQRRRRLLPAGPWREPLEAARRAHLLVVTRKAAARDAVRSATAALGAVAPDVPQAVVHLAPGVLCGADGERVDARALRGRRVLALAGVGDPGAFFRQMRGRGADVIERAYRDHHAFGERDAVALAAAASGVDYAVCTLKDYVKLAPVWPRQAPRLWYVSQRVEVERGAEALDALLDAVLETVFDTAGRAARPASPIRS